MNNKITLLVLSLGLLLSSCGGDKKFYGKMDKSPYAINSCIKELSRGAELDHANSVDKIVVYKGKRKLYTYRNGKEIHEFRISLGKNGDKGNKQKVGDYRTPEGTYTIIRKKCDSRLYKSLLISYPNQADRNRASKKGLRPGGYITIHGQPKWNADGRGDDYTLANDWTEGCMAVPNAHMDILWSAVANGVKITIHP